MLPEKRNMVFIIALGLIKSIFVIFYVSVLYSLTPQIPNMRFKDFNKLYNV